MPTMDDGTPALPDLDATVQKLDELLSIEEHKLDVSQATDLYVTALGLLCLLAHDQERVRKFRDGEENAKICWNDIPTFEVIAKGHNFFYSLVRCLESSKSTLPTEALETNTGSRKRSMSLSDPVMKKSASPMPPQRHVHETNKKKPEFDRPVFAAVVLYTVFQHFKHWPAVLARAYAVDCFGPKVWVDSPECSMFVANLALSHKPGDTLPNFSSEDLDVARKIAGFYQSASDFHEPGRFTQLEHQLSSSSLGSDQVIPKRHASAMPRGTDDNENTRKRSRIVENEKEESDHGRSNSEEDTSMNLSASGDEEDRQGRKRKRENGGTNDLEDISVSSGEGITKNESSVENCIEFPVQLHEAFANFEPRMRFIGYNLDCAHEAIVASLEDRLDTKTKQNSGLLQCLPDFVSIHAVRRIVGLHIERWLQSPALAGLARVLLGATVNNMKDENPPRDEDLSFTKAVLTMKLKSNQLNTLLSTVEGITKRLRGRAIVHFVYSILLRQYVTSSGQVADQQKESDTFHLLCVIHREVSSKHSYDAIASAVMNLVKEYLSSSKESSEQDRIIRRVRDLIRSLTTQAANGFDAKMFLDSFLLLATTADKWSRREEEFRARLIIHFVILSIFKFYQKETKNIAPCDIETVRKYMTEARKSIVVWCCTKYGPHFVAEKRRKSSTMVKIDSISGLMQPDYRSVFASDIVDIPKWIEIVLCVLLIKDPTSMNMKKFMFPREPSESDDAEWDDDLPILQCCCRYSDRVGGDLVRSILHSTSNSRGIDPEIAIQMLEQLFYSCCHERQGVLTIDDPDIVWELYGLVQYEPPRPNPKEAGKDLLDKIDLLPRLAHTGLWWRVTVLCLVLSSHSPKNIGFVLWNTHPTVRSLLKMVASQRYRFPTVDCDDVARAKTKEDEKAARDSELNAIELLFLPNSNKPLPVPKAKSDTNRGQRVSRRLLAQQKAREVADEQKEHNRRKQILKETQKAIMLWDPKGPARKPPKESIGFLQAAVSAFNISLILQQCTEPDFLLMTIGATSRDSIERAHDWLIPVISRVPDAVRRLPSNAACFLLLRAYGTEGQKRRQLKELSAPLLSNVKDSLEGRFGGAAAVEAFELLMTDVAGKNAERRRWARRVLQDALVPGNDEGIEGAGWMATLTELSDAKVLVPIAINHLAKAATYEKGDQLRALVQALQRHINFALEQDIKTSVRSFPAMLIDLVYGRPSIFIEAFSRYPDVCEIASVAFQSEFKRICVNNDGEMKGGLRMKILENNIYREITVSLQMLTAIAVVLSVWCGDITSDSSAATSIRKLCDGLFPPDDLHHESSHGLVSAKIPGSKAVPVEPKWILVAKAQHPLIAKRAAFAAPPEFLVRLLQCSGLPKASYLSMMNRLSKLCEEESDDFHHFFSPPQLSKWDIARETGSKSLTKVLLGRINAYKRLHSISHDEDSSSNSFQQWLQKENNSQNMNQKTVEPTPAVREKTKTLLFNFKESLKEPIRYDLAVESKKIKKPNTDRKSLLPFKSVIESAPRDDGEIDPSIAIEACLVSGDMERFQRLCRVAFDWKHCNDTLSRFKHAAISLFENCSSQNRKRLAALVVRWFPALACHDGNDAKLYDILFRQSDNKKVLLSFETCLIHECIRSWDKMERSRCFDLIVDHGSKNGNSIGMARFILFSQNFRSIPFHFFEDDQYATLVSSKGETLSKIVVVATNGLNEEKYSLKALTDCSMATSPSTLLLQLIASIGKDQSRVCFDSLSSESTAASTTADNSSHPEVFLRLYLMHPQWPDLSSEHSRTQLMNASQSFAGRWTNWWSSLDGRTDDLLRLMEEGDAKTVKEISEMARKQPLLILRKLPLIRRMLTRDASVHPLKARQGKGVITGQHLDGPRDVKLDGKLMKFCCRHWGYDFFEPLWIAWLDILSHIPKAVLFSCGPPAGLDSFLDIYIQLLSIQLQLMSANEVCRLKDKVKSLFEVYRQSNAQGWRHWLQSPIGSSQVRHVLLGCDLIDIKEAIDQFKPAP